MNKFFNKILASSLFAAGLAFAQSGLNGGSDGIHQVSANTLGQWGVAIGLGGQISVDSWSLARAGQMTGQKNEEINLYGMSFSFTGTANLALGLTNWLDIGASMPLYEDYAADHNGNLDKYAVNDIDRGDLETWLKLRLIGNSESVFKTALLAQFSIPTGDEYEGMRPRHVWYLGKNTRPYTAGDFTVAGSALFTFDFNKKNVPLRWNTQVGYLYPFDEDESGTLLYSTGLNWSPVDVMDIFVEFSGEMHLQDDIYEIDPIADVMILTPGMRFRLNDYMDVSMGLDINARTLTNLDFDQKKDLEDCKNSTITHETRFGKKLTSCYAGAPTVGGSASLVWRFGGDKKKKKPEEPKQNEPAKIDTLIKNDTLYQVKNDTLIKIELKTDTSRDDSIKARAAAIADSNSQIKIDSLIAANKVLNDSIAKMTGDEDKDGIMNLFDKCPATAEGIKVDDFGCEVDSDKDGVVDSKDKCPATVAGAKVNEEGCELDDDEDGVINSADSCPNTLEGVAVDAKGCPSNKNEDLVKLQQLVKFKKGTAKITKPGLKALDNVAKLMIARNDLRIEIQGHADDAKKADMNQDLSTNRAQAVVDYLIKKGVPSKHVRAVGFGNTKPVVAAKPNKKGKVKSNPKNNRVEFDPRKKKPKAEAQPAPAPAAPAAQPAPAPAAPAAQPAPAPAAPAAQPAPAPAN